MQKNDLREIKCEDEFILKERKKLENRFKKTKTNGYIEKLMTAYSKILDDRLSMEQ